MFRQKALENRNMKWRGRSILLPGIPLWLVITSCLFFLITFIVFITEGTYTRRANVGGEITTSPRAINIYSSVQGFIVKSFVTEGQIIKKGDAIYQIDVSKSTKDGVVSDSQKADIENQLTKIKNIITRLEESKKTTLNMLEKQKIQYTEAYKNSTKIIGSAEKGIRIMKDNVDSYQKYHDRGLINKDQLINQIAIYYQQQNNLLGLNSQNEQNALQITSLENQILTQAAEFDNRIYQMELQRYDLHKEMINADVNGEVIVRALSDGKIDSLSVTEGQMVNAGDSLLQIIPQKITNYYLVLWVPNDAVPFIAVGDKVNIRYEAFPVEKFGQFSATITHISRTPASPQEMLTYQGAPTKNTQTAPVPYYKVMVKPEQQSIRYDGKNILLENGMKAQGTLFLEKRKVYQWMFSPFYDVKHSTMGPVNE